MTDRSAHRSGFTLLETVLATVIGAMVLAAAMSLFIAMSRAERAMNRASRQMEEMAITQQVLRRSFMTMVLAAQSSVDEQMRRVRQDNEITDEERAALPRPRLLLEFDKADSIALMRSNAAIDGVILLDPSGFGGAPQRLEITLPDKPVPESMRLIPPAWVAAPSDDLLRSFDPTGVDRPDNETGLRGCFELRPDGARERVMEGLGIIPASEPGIRPRLPASRRPPEGWTLWWRPMYGAEIQARQHGVPYDIDRHPELLAEAVPLIRGVRMMRWYAFAAEEDPDNPDAPVIAQRWAEYAGTTTDDIPGYMEAELETTSGSYASWMFEMGWSLADEYVVEGTDNADEEDPAGEQPPQDGRPSLDGADPLNQLNSIGGQS
ncbi:MAG TPA: hypothetical protein ENK11_08670 [Phycisphaerales bacterium]|nr:hypothetical protein [Phycisphaerales bacterium]